MTEDEILRECSKDEASYQKLRELFNRLSKDNVLEQYHIEQRRYQALFDQSNDAVFILDLDGNHIDANDYAAELLGYSVDEIRGMSYRQIVPEAEQPAALNARQRLIRGERIPPYERIFQHRDGTLIPVELNVACVFDDHGNPAHIQSIARDIRERAQMMAALKEAELRYRTIIAAMAEGVVMQRNDGVILEANPAAERILGLTVDQLMGRSSIDPRWRSIHEDGSPFPGETHPAMVTLSTGEPQSNVIMGVHKPEGDLTWISVNSEPLFLDENDAQPHAVIATFTDITELQNAHLHDVKLAIEQERMEFITQFIRNVSHEFRTPLAIINTSTYFINHSTDPIRQKQQTEKINRQVTRMSELVSTLLLITRLHTEPDLTFSTVELKDLLFQTKELSAEQGSNAGVEVRVETVPETVTVDADAALLLEALRRIIDNAIRYTPSGGTVTVNTTVQDKSIAIDITDTGIGMSDEVLPHIFERFWRMDDAHTEPGFGLGLPIAQRIIHLHDGEIYVNSEPDAGTTVTVYLPLKV